MSDTYLESLKAKMGDLIQEAQIEANKARRLRDVEEELEETPPEEKAHPELALLEEQADAVTQGNFGNINELFKGIEAKGAEAKGTEAKGTVTKGDAKEIETIVNRLEKLLDMTLDSPRTSRGGLQNDPDLPPRTPPSRTPEPALPPRTPPSRTPEPALPPKTPPSRTPQDDIKVRKTRRDIAVYNQLEYLLYICARKALPIMLAETKAKEKEAIAIAKRDKERRDLEITKAAVYAQGESWRPLEDWELHHQYILEIFNPQTKVYVGPLKLDEDLKEGEEIEDRGRPALQSDWLSWVTWVPVLGKLWTIYRLTESGKVTVWKSAQAEGLDGIDLEDPVTGTVQEDPVDEEARALDQELKRLLDTMVDREKKTLHDDHVIELYDGRTKHKHYDYNKIFFDYSYTNHERKSIFYGEQKETNERQPRALLAGLVGTFAGQVTGHLLGTAVRFGLELYPAVVFLVSQKCQA